MAAPPCELPSGAPDELQRRGWTAALDRLEEDLDRAEQLLRDPDRVSLPAWSPPTLGPMPIELLGRATDLNHRQQTVQAHLATALRANTRQRGYATRVSDATALPTRPTYFDESL